MIRVAKKKKRRNKRNTSKRFGWRCPACGRRLMIYPRRNIAWHATCVCGFGLQGLEKDDVYNKLRSIYNGEAPELNRIGGQRNG